MPKEKYPNGRKNARAEWTWIGMHRPLVTYTRLLWFLMDRLNGVRVDILIQFFVKMLQNLVYQFSFFTFDVAPKWPLQMLAFQTEAERKRERAFIGPLKFPTILLNASLAECRTNRLWIKCFECLHKECAENDIVSVSRHCRNRQKSSTTLFMAGPIIDALISSRYKFEVKFLFHCTENVMCKVQTDRLRFICIKTCKLSAFSIPCEYPERKKIYAILRKDWSNYDIRNALIRDDVYLHLTCSKGTGQSSYVRIWLEDFIATYIPVITNNVQKQRVTFICGDSVFGSCSSHLF